MADDHGGGGVLRELLAVFSFGIETKELEKGKNELAEFGEKVKKIGEAIVAAFAVEQIYEFAEQNVKAMTAIERQASRLGISTDQVQAYTFAAKSLGLESETLLNMMGRLQVTQEAAAKGGKQQSEAFATLGVKVRDASGKTKDADSLFRDVAESLSKQTDASKQAYLAQELFGRGGRELLPILKKGSEGLDELIETYHQLGGGFTNEAIEKAKDFEEQQAKLGLVWTQLKSTALEWLLPAITKIVIWVGKGVHAFAEYAKKSNVVQATLIVLGAAATAFAIKMAIANAPIVAMVLALAALVLLVDDFVTMMQGGDSLIGRAIDRLFGKDAHVDAVKEIKKTWSEVLEVIKGLWTYVEKVWSYYKWVLDHASALGRWIGDKTFDKKWAEEEGDRRAGEQRRPLMSAQEFAERQRVKYGLPVAPKAQIAGTGAMLLQSSGPIRDGGGAMTHKVDVHVKHDPGVIVEVSRKTTKEQHAHAKAAAERVASR